MDYWQIALVVALLILALLGLRGVRKGQFKRIHIGKDGIEIEGADKAGSESVATPTTSNPGIQQAPAPDRPPKEARWRDHVDADYEIFFGRTEQQIDTLVELMSRGPSGSITSIRGEGGIGKTASACEAIKVAGDHYSMIAWASFRQHQNPKGLERGQSVGRSSREVLRDLSRQLGLNINTNDAVIAEQFSSAMRRAQSAEPILLVVDNLERLVDVEDIVRHFIRNELLQHCHLVLTTRVSAVRVSKTIDERVIGNLPLEPSCDLIRHEGRGSLDVSSADNAVLKPIHTVTDGNPYLMKLVARRLCYQTSPLDNLLRDIRQLDAAGVSSLSTAAILDYMFTASLQQLAALVGEQNTRSLIHAFGSEPPGSRIAYDSLRILTELRDDEFQRALDAAHDLSLVTKHGLNERFSIHSLLHSYATGWSAK